MVGDVGRLDSLIGAIVEDEFLEVILNCDIFVYQLILEHSWSGILSVRAGPILPQSVVLRELYFLDQIFDHH